MKLRRLAAVLVVTGAAITLWGVRSARENRRQVLAGKSDAAARARIALQDFCRSASLACDHLTGPGAGELVDDDTFDFEWNSPADRRVSFLVEVPPAPGRVRVRPLSGALEIMKGVTDAK